MATDERAVDVGGWRFWIEPNNWLKPIQQGIIASYLDRACLAIGARLHDHPDVHEVTLTDLLYEDYLSEGPRLFRLMSALEHNGLHIEVEGRVMNIPEEAEFGADLGVVLQLQTDELTVEKATLLQAKRLSLSGDNAGYNDLLTPHARRQARRMLRVTPASFFILYNPFAGRPVKDREFAEEFPHRTRVNFLHPDVRVGIMVLPVMTQIGLGVPSSVERVTPYTLPFTNFFVDDFLQCKVGDGRRRTIQIASGRNERFPVRRSVTLSLSTAD